MMELDLWSSTFLVGWLAATVRLAGPLLLAALGELFAERSGVLNIGIEGLMLLGALASYLATLYTGESLAGTERRCAGRYHCGQFSGLDVRHSRCQSGRCGYHLQYSCSRPCQLYLSAGAARCGRSQTVDMFDALPIPFLSDLPLIGPILFRHTMLLYITAGLVIVAGFVLYRTRLGLNLRAVGENPRAADTAGINVATLRYIGVLISAGAAGAAGAYLVLAQVGQFRESIVAGQGFIALAIVIFGRWDPYKAALAALIFGAADALQLSLQLFQVGLPPQLLLALPYVLTIIAMSGLIGKTRQPEAFMVPYRKE
ncbi:MAG: ABC transporter permease [Gammaproteobacteria bacterium]